MVFFNLFCPFADGSVRLLLWQIQAHFVMKIEDNTKLTIQVILAVVLVLAGIVLLFCGFIVAPSGEIHDSVLIGSGETFTFAGNAK